MLKRSILSLFIFSIISCKVVKLKKITEAQKINFNVKEEVIAVSEDNRVLLKFDATKNFFLDLGAPNSIFKEDESNFIINDSLILGELEKPNGETIENKMVVVNNFNCPIVNIQNAVFRLIPKLENCNSSIGILGPEVFVNKIVELNFKDGILKLLETSEHLEGYKFLKVVDFDGYYFFVEIYLNGKPIKVKFDTGNPYQIIIINDILDFTNASTHFFSWYLNGNNQLDSNIISKDEFAFSENEIKQEAFTINNKKIKRSLIGMGIIKNYDWILDYKNGKIYYKLNKQTVPVFTKNRYKMRKGILTLTEAENIQKSNLGKIVKSIDKIDIGIKDKCEIKNKLNSTSNNYLVEFN